MTYLATYLNALAGGEQTEVVGALKAQLGMGGYTVPMFDSIETAIQRAVEDGVSLRGIPGDTYVFEQGITLTDPTVVFDFTGCKLERSPSVANGQPLIRINSSFSAATFGTAPAVLAMDMVEYDYGNGPIFVPRITVASVAGYAVGDIVKVLSSDRIPALSFWPDYRYAEMGEVGAIDTGSKYLYLLRPFAETWTPEKIVRLTSRKIIITGGEWSDDPDYDPVQVAPAVLLNGAVRPVIQGAHFRDTAGTQIRWLSCYEPTSRGNRFDRARFDTTYSAFGYGDSFLACTRPVAFNTRASGMRHAFDTGSGDITDVGLATAPVENFGGTIEGVCIGGVAEDSLNAPFNDHPDAYRTRFINCVSNATNRRSTSATLWGVQLRGRGSSVEGGYFEAITPVHVEPATDIPNVLTGFTGLKIAYNETDVSRGALVEIVGTGLVLGDRANVIIKPAFLHQKNGREEMFKITSSNVRFEGDIKYDFSQSNAVVFNLTDSKLTIDRMNADFGEATDVTPMLTLLTDAASEVLAVGKVHVIDSPEAGNSGVVLTDFDDEAGTARWMDVYYEGDFSFFSQNGGWRNAASAATRWSRTYNLTTDRVPSDITVNFSTGSGPKSIPESAWAPGRGERTIHVAVNPTTNGTYVGTIPAGSFIGQRLELTNVAASFTFEVQAYGNIAVAATRTVAVGGTTTLRWDGTAWT